MAARDLTHRRLAALAVYCLVAGASFLTMLQVCTRCGMDNAYLGEVFLGLIIGLMGVIFGLTWLIMARREGIRGLVAGGLSGIAVACVVLAIGATQTLVPPALSAMELVVIAAGVVSTVALTSVPSRTPTPR